MLIIKAVQYSLLVSRFTFDSAPNPGTSTAGQRPANGYFIIICKLQNLLAKIHISQNTPCLAGRKQVAVYLVAPYPLVISTETIEKYPVWWRNVQCPFRRFCGKNHGKTTSFSTYNIRLKLASLTTFKTTAAIDSGATPCFQIYFGDVGGLLEHRDILQNSSETAMHPLVLFWLDPAADDAGDEMYEGTKKFVLLFYR